MNLFDDNHSTRFSTNNDYAAQFELKKRTEELSKLQDKYGKHYTLEDEEDQEELLSDDDEEGELVTPQVDIAILRTLARIRTRDPAVYEQNRQVFDEEEMRTVVTSVKEKKEKPSKPIRLADYQRTRRLLDPTDSLPDQVDPTTFLPTFAQEERDLKLEVTRAFRGEEEEEEQEEELLVKRVKSKDERDRDDQEYTQFLKDNVGDREVEDALEQEEKFLRDYILNRGWIDRSGKSNRIPSYNEITGGPTLTTQKPKTIPILSEVNKEEEETVADPGANDSEDNEYESEAEEFENQYNFRFEEAAGNTMITHSRGASTVRRPTVAVTARARARDTAKDRAAEQKLERREEIRRMKALKRKEVEEKLLKLVEAAGEGAEGLGGMDLETDWDPVEHDRKMAEVYGGDYAGAQDDQFKPSWSDDEIDISDIQALNGEVPSDAEEEADEEEFQEEEEEEEEEEVATIKSAKKGGKRKRDEEGFPAGLLEAAKKGGGAERAALLESMIDEYYNIDYEDKIGGMPVRFSYAKVAPSSYALETSEILMATDNELNSYMSLRKLAPYRSEEEKKGKSKKRLKEFRDGLRSRKWGEEIDLEKEQEMEARNGGKRVKWSEVDGRTNLESVASFVPTPKEFTAIKIPSKETVGGTERRAKAALEGPVKRVGKKERERRKKAALLAGEEAPVAAA